MLSGAGKALRFFVSDRLGIVILLWMALAFLVRPAFMDAHVGAPGAAADWLRGRMDELQLARMAGMVQWTSLAGLVLATMLTHVRIASLFPAFAEDWRGRFAIGAAYAWACVGGFLAFIWTPTTAVSLMLHDTFIFYDAIYRIHSGQTPSVDFPTSLGAACLYLPALAAKITGGYAGSIELSSAFVALALCLVTAFACARRHSGAVSAVLIVTVFLMVVPVMLEGWRSHDSLTFEGGELAASEQNFALAMFYNRWGWGALVAMFAFLTPRKEAGAPPLSEILVQAAVLVFLFWLKLSYFVVGAASCCLYAYLSAKPVRTLVWGGGVALAGVLSVGLLLGNLAGYLGDVAFASRVSGARISRLAELIRDNLVDMAIAASPIILMALTGKLKRNDILICGLMMLGTLFVINQNAQYSGMPTLLCIAAYAVWRLKDDENKALKYAAVIALSIPAANLFLDRASGLMGQTVLTRREEARPQPTYSQIPALSRVYVQEHENVLKLYEEASTTQEKVDAFVGAAMFSRRQIIRSGEYLATLEEAMAELRPVMKPNESVAVMDFASPLAFLMNARSARGYWITFDDDRTISETVHPEGAQLFADADHVMMPKIFLEPDTANRLRFLYEDYLKEAYVERVDTAHWVRFSHRKDRSGLRARTTDEHAS
jgi:hypothetical protein